VGRSGVVVTRVILGCGNFGGVGSAPAFWGQGIPKDEAFAIMDGAWNLGITTFDTADAYGGTRSESWIGEWLATQDDSVRDAIAIQSKTFNPIPPHDDYGLAGSRILRQVETSLDRLGVRGLDVYMAHDFDPGVPQEASLRAFDQVVRDGKARAIGASNFTAEQLAEAVEISELEGLARYECVQNTFSLLEQGDAETVLPVCREHGLAYQAHSPLAGGWLAGRYRRGEPYPDGSRMTQRPEPYTAYTSDAVFDALEALEREAQERGVSIAALSLAWLLGVEGLAAVVVGPTRRAHLEEVHAALRIGLSPAEHEHLRGLFA
jgi:1-deoxyxylulose-5-phosphate synthase